jgi:hypothetical protein
LKTIRCSEIAVAEEKEQTRVWIGVGCVVPREWCELLSPHEGAYVNLLTLANSEAEYRAKISDAAVHYCLELQGLEDVRPLSESEGASEEIMSIAAEIEAVRNPKHVRY